MAGASIGTYSILTKIIGPGTYFAHLHNTTYRIGPQPLPLKTATMVKVDYLNDDLAPLTKSLRAFCFDFLVPTVALPIA